MNRDVFLSVFRLPRTPSDHLKGLCAKYQEFMTAQPQQPEAFAPRPASVRSRSKAGKSKEDSASVTNTLSICSNLSRLQVDKLVIQNILNNRKDHALFSELEENESEKAKIWYYQEEKDSSIQGPLTNGEMDQRWELGVLKPQTKIKKKFDEEYSPLLVYVKRYYKNVLSERIEFEKKEAGKLSNKIINFHKGEAIKAPMKVKEKFDPKQREERFFSHAIRPKLVDLNHLLPKDADEEDNNLYSRLRANTLNQK